ncbi:MAG: alpha/beta hydrolase [Clostridia bacterium]|nr:alpha/beta hydrolase [Clostridia bacterium]
MKGILKKVLSVILILAVVIVPMVTLCSSAKGIKRTCPNIEVHGFMASKIYSDKDDPNSTVVWPPNPDSILELAKKDLPEAAKLAYKKDWNGFAENVAMLIYKSLFPVFVGEDGAVHDNSGAYFVYPEADTITAESEVQFTYDWRTDPVEIAAKLNDYVNYILKCSGCDKLTIECHSLGGAIVTTYLAIYGCDKVKSVAFNSTAVFGSSFISEMMSGKLNLDAQSLQEYLYFAFDYSEYHYLINGLINLARDLGILDLLANAGKSVFDAIGFIVAKEAVVPMFGNWLTIWCMIPNDEFQRAYDNVFNKVYAGEDHSALKAKIENYNKLVRYKKTDTLLELNKKANVYVISRYGYSSVPAIQSYESISDGIIDVKYASFGATTSLYGQELNESYLSTVPVEYVSPNKSIDASTCMFPEQTWFVYSMRHFKSPKPLAEFIDMLLAYDGQADVYTFKEYPRFLAYDAATNSIAEDVNSSAMSLFRKIIIIINEVFSLIKRWFTKK